MKLNRVEWLLMNNPVRASLQRRVEARAMERIGGKTRGLRVLEIGCGRGVGTEILMRRFAAREVVAFDYDVAMVRLAQRRLAREHNIYFSVASADAIPQPDASFDAVFDFGVLHHVPDWRYAVVEIKRVLAPGGRFYFEEVTEQALQRWSFRTFLKHPECDRFTEEQFLAELRRNDIVVDARRIRRVGKLFFLGVGRHQTQKHEMVEA